MRRQELHLAYVLHSRAYRESSLILELLCADHGRIALVARGAKRGKAKQSAMLQLFTPLLISWYGDGDLATLTHVEPAAVAHELQARKAICGLYINELLTKLLHKWDPCAQLFAQYQALLLDLANADLEEQIILRNFEKHLLKSLGYALQLSRDIATGARVKPELYYLFDPVLGPSLVSERHINAVKGESLLAFEVGTYTSAEILSDVKHLMRLVLAHHLGTRRLVTRELL